MRYDIYCAIEQDYSKWLNTIPDQLGYSIEHGNRIYERLKNKLAKRLSKKYKIDLSEIKNMVIFKN